MKPRSVSNKLCILLCIVTFPFIEIFQMHVWCGNYLESAEVFPVTSLQLQRRWPEVQKGVLPGPRESHVCPFCTACF
jgi:hypothetical protein